MLSSTAIIEKSCTSVVDEKAIDNFNTKVQGYRENKDEYIQGKALSLEEDTMYTRKEKNSEPVVYYRGFTTDDSVDDLFKNGLIPNYEKDVEALCHSESVYVASVYAAIQLGISGKRNGFIVAVALQAGQAVKFPGQDLAITKSGLSDGEEIGRLDVMEVRSGPVSPENILAARAIDAKGTISNKIIGNKAAIEKHKELINTLDKNDPNFHKFWSKPSGKDVDFNNKNKRTGTVDKVEVLPRYY